MAFQISLGEVDEARAVAERAIETINYRCAHRPGPGQRQHQHCGAAHTPSLLISDRCGAASFSGIYAFGVNHMACGPASVAAPQGGE